MSLPIVLDKVKCRIWQVGTFDINTKKEFFQEGRIEEDIIEESSLKVMGKTEKELRDKKEQSQKKLIENFFSWIEKRKMKNFLCQNPQFDVGYLEIKSKKYWIKKIFHYRSFDLHSIAQTKYIEIKKKFFIEEDHSGMGLTKILEFCGIKDERKAHNALEDAKLTAECFSRLIYGKGLISEYSKFPVTKELLKWT